MKLAAIICEYNPFHKGHKFHIEETRKKSGADAVIAIMSGNFVQRGEPAIYPKAVRAEAALKGGADLVLELPTVYATGSAEYFAIGAVKILNALNCVDFLSFGAEVPDANSLLKIAELLITEPDEFSQKLKEYSAKGLSFPSARAKAVGEVLGVSAEDILNKPNNLLAVEYCKALLKTKSTISPLPIQRTGANHDSDSASDGIASATHIRSLILGGKSEEAFKYMPDFSGKLFSTAQIHCLNALESAILCQLIKFPPEQLQEVSDVSEGLENRIKAAAMTATTLEELCELVKTKRYTHSRIRRIVLSAFLGISDPDRKLPPQYIKILAHTETGQKIIAKAKKSATLPLVRNTSQVNKLNNPLIKEQWERERIFDRLYEMSEVIS